MNHDSNTKGNASSTRNLHNRSASQDRRIRCDRSNALPLGVKVRHDLVKFDD